MKRTVTLTFLCVMLALLLSGCTSNADTVPSPSAGMPSPAVSPMISPDMSDMPSPTDNMLDGILSDVLPGGDKKTITTAEDALNASKALRDAVEKLTEVDTAMAVVTGNTALVGLSYDSSYQGGIDDRLRGMILDRAKAVHPAIDSVAVTDDVTQSSEIASLYQMLQSGTPFTTVKANADTLADGLDMFKK